MEYPTPGAKSYFQTVDGFLTRSPKKAYPFLVSNTWYLRGVREVRGGPKDSRFKQVHRTDHGQRRVRVKNDNEDQVLSFSTI